MNNTVQIAPRYLTPRQAAAYLNVSVWTIYRLVEQRQIPFIPLTAVQKSSSAKKRPSLRFDVKALDRWMEQRAIKEAV
jgi:hypothetical protein